MSLRSLHLRPILLLGLICFSLSTATDATAQTRRSLEVGAGTERSLVVEQLSLGTVAPPTVALPTAQPTAPFIPVVGTGPDEISLMMRIQFDYDSSELKVEAMQALDIVASAMLDSRHDRERFAIEGHTDATGGWGYNQGLSERRAQAVAGYLALRGVDRFRMIPVGMSWNRPLPYVAPRSEAHRRVEIGRIGS